MITLQLSKFRYRGIVGFGSKSSTESNTEVYLTFHLTVRASHFHGSNYSEYQQFLYQTIASLREKGQTFKHIAERLNENGFSTVRGNMFRDIHDQESRKVVFRY